jgi:RNase P/RNase MRP subunit p29
MRWPDIFFKPRKPNPIPAIATVPSKGGEAAKSAPDKTEIERVETVRNEKEKTESLRALAESGQFGAAKDAPETDASSGKPAETDSGNAKTTMLPVAPPRGGSVSLRQRAKLTDDALSLPRQEENPAPEPEKPKPVPETSEAKTSEPAKSETPAVVPAAFPVSVETGSVLEKPEEKKPEPAAAAETETAKGAEAAEPPGNKPATGPLPVRREPAESASSPGRETARVHIAHTTTSAPPASLEPIKADTREKTEFILSNGERIFGHILSETPQTIYLDHGTLGVLTLPRSQIATKPIEVILINGDRIVGDLIAETPECLYIKHASLGMLTVPHGQRSTRVVEAILKDGDRILGEVLAETDNFTVIRSATLGTVAVQHEQVAMLNRKIEQMQLRALPLPAAKLDDRKDVPAA